MDRIAVTPRPDWKEQAESHGFVFHTIGGAPYWDETHAYRFSLAEVESEIEDPTAELEQMCYAVVERAVSEPNLLHRLAIPEPFHEMIRRTWRRGDKNLYGRFDFAYGAGGAAKLLEYNADTPTSLYESSVFQWLWLEQAMERGIIAEGCDQFNSLHERLVEAFSRFGIKPSRLHLGAVMSSSEDRGTVEYLMDCALQGGVDAELIDMAEIGIDAQGNFTDLEDRVIPPLFKLSPWEFMVREPFGQHLLGDRAQIIEPAWKMVLSNKGLLALLWEMNPGHRNLLPAWFADDPSRPWEKLGGRLVRKPLLSREGANVEILDGAATLASTGGDYGAEGHVIQAYHPLPTFGADHAVIGSWVVAGEPAGLGIREDATAVTQDTSRFLPHFLSG
jgi:glutathionylspermidine synthase